MTRILQTEDRQGGHALPLEVRKHSVVTSASNVRTNQRSPNESPSLHDLALHAKGRKATRDLHSDADAKSIVSDRHASGASLLSQIRSNSIDTRSNRGIRTTSRMSSLVDSPLNSAVFRRKGSAPLGLSDDFTPEPSPASNASLELYREEVRANNTISNEIKELGDTLDYATTTAHLNEKIGDAMIAYYTGHGASMLGELTTVTQVAQMYELNHIMARAQLWKAMILHEMGEDINMADLLIDVLPHIVHDEECTDADRYHMRRLVLLYGDEIWLQFESLRRDNSPTDHMPVDPTSPNTEQSMLIWGQGVIQQLQNGIGDKSGLWPNLEESLNAVEFSCAQRESAPKDLLPEFEERYRELLAYNEQLEADVARYRAERQVYGDLNTPDYPPPNDYRLPSVVGSEQSSRRPEFESKQFSQADSDESWLGTRSMSETLHRMSEDLAGIGNGSAIRHLNSSPRRASRKQSSISSPRARLPLRVRNRTPGSSGKSSRTALSSHLRRKSSRSSLGLDRRGPSSSQLHSRTTLAPLTYQANNAISERRGSNLKNMALAESYNEDQEDPVSPKDVSHRKPAYVRQRPSIDTRSPGKLVIQPESNTTGSFDAVSGRQTDETDEDYELTAILNENRRFRRRSSVSNSESILQIDSEEIEMTGALSPTELEQRLPKYLEHKEQDRRKVVRSSDFPKWNQLQEKLLSPQRRERPQAETKVAPSIIAQTELTLVPEPSKQAGMKASDPPPKFVRKTPTRKPNYDFDFGFDFDHVQQEPQHSDRTTSQTSLNSNLSARRNCSTAPIAPLTPNSKSPSSSAISIPRDPFKDRPMYASPRAFGFDASIARDDEVQPSAPATLVATAHPQVMESAVSEQDLPRRKYRLPEIKHDFIPDNIRDRKQSSEQSNGTSNSSSRGPASNRISTFIRELTNEPYIPHQRRDSVPIVSSPLRSSFGLDEESGELASPPTEDPFMSASRFKPERLTKIDTAARDHERPMSIYDHIADDYPSPSGTEDEQREKAEVGTAQRQHQESEDIGYETDTDSDRRGRSP